MTSAGYESHLKRLAASFSHTRRESKRGGFKKFDVHTFKTDGTILERGELFAPIFENKFFLSNNWKFKKRKKMTQDNDE